MKKILMLAVILTQTATAQHLSVKTGYQQENFHWSIAGNSSGQDPNIYSELKWKKLSGPVTALDLDWRLWKWLSIRGQGSWMFTSSGDVTDMDYQADNRQQPVYQGYFSCDKGNIYDWALMLGGDVWHSGVFTFSPYVGYSVNAQDMYIVDKTGVYSNLNTRYAARWKGAVARLDGSWSLKHWVLDAGVDYHQVVYRAEADWNLIPSFSHPVSFRHRANGYGIGANAGISYLLSDRWSLGIGGGWYHWQTGAGTDQLYLAAGGSEYTQMNGAFRDGWQLGLHLKYSKPGL